MQWRAIGVGLVALLVVGSVVGAGVAHDELEIRGEPDLDVYAPEPIVTPGTTSQVVLQVANDGEVRSGVTTTREIVTTARSVTVEVDDDDAPFTVETRTQSIGTIADGDVREVPITVSVPTDASPGEYSIDVELGYSYTARFEPDRDSMRERSDTTTKTIDVVVEDGPRFELDAVDSDVQIGDTGTLETEITNVGGEDARDLTIQLESTSPDVGLGGEGANTAWIDELEAGETASFEQAVTIRPDAADRDLSIAGSVRFTDPDGVQSVQEGLSIGFGADDEQSFDVSVTDSTLRVGEIGTIRGVIVNDGPHDVESVVVSLGETQLEPRSATYAVGDLEAGEEATFQFRGTVPPSADAVPQRIDVTTAYRTAAGTDRSTTDPIEVSVADRRDAVSVRGVDATFAADESGTLELEITNQRDVELRDVRVQLFVDEPLESDFRTAVVPSMEPGESHRVAFDLEVDEDAPVSQYPAVVEINYTDPDDEAVAARPSTIAVSVTEADEVLPVTEVVGGILAIVVLGAGAWWFYGRRLV
ncbi:MAG: COG1361 S-layer family protein [Halobacteriota archaeon]